MQAFWIWFHLHMQWVSVWAPAADITQIWVRTWPGQVISCVSCLSLLLLHKGADNSTRQENFKMKEQMHDKQEGQGLLMEHTRFTGALPGRQGHCGTYTTCS